MTNLTIPVDNRTLARLKHEAQERHTTVEAVVLDRIGAEPHRRRVEIPPNSSAARVYGMIRRTTDKSDDDVLYEALAEKHGVNE